MSFKGSSVCLMLNREYRTDISYLHTIKILHQLSDFTLLIWASSLGGSSILNYDISFSLHYHNPIIHHLKNTVPLN